MLLSHRLVKCGKSRNNIDSIGDSRLEEGNSYIFLDNIRDVAKKLQGYFENQPDVVKIYLLYSDNYQERYEDDKLANSGLSVEVAKEVVQRAKKRRSSGFCTHAWLRLGWG